MIINNNNNNNNNTNYNQKRNIEAHKLRRQVHGNKISSKISTEFNRMLPHRQLPINHLVLGEVPLCLLQPQGVLVVAGCCPHLLHVGPISVVLQPDRVIGDILTRIVVWQLIIDIVAKIAIVFTNRSSSSSSPLHHHQRLCHLFFSRLLTVVRVSSMVVLHRVEMLLRKTSKHPSDIIKLNG